MKEVRAYIKPHKLSEVTLALHSVKGLTGMTVIDARGFGRNDRPRAHETADDVADHLPCARLEVVCAENLVETVVDVIRKHAHTGLKGDGKIYIFEVGDAIHIRTGERGA